MSSARPTRQRKAPKRFDDNFMYFDEPQAKRQPKEQSIVEVVAATPVVPVIPVPPPIQPAVVQESGGLRKRVYPKCKNQKCDCMAIRRRIVVAIKLMKTPEKTNCPVNKRTVQYNTRKKIEAPKMTKKGNRAPLAGAVKLKKTKRARRFV